MRYDYPALFVLFATLSSCSNASDTTSAAEGGSAGVAGHGATGSSSALGGQASSTENPTTTGGTPNSGSSSRGGGQSSSGGRGDTGGATTAVESTGGYPAGSTSATTQAFGGAIASSGGKESIGGKMGSGGSMTSPNSAAGGTTQTGGSRATGGARETGGATAAGASTPTGGTRASGGATLTGSTPATGGATSGGCDTPPAPSELVGWAAVGGGTTGGGDANPTVVTTLAQLQSAAKGTTATVIHVKGVLTPGVISIGSNKTIVGLCGAEIHGHVGLSQSSNVIIRNIKIVGYAVGDCKLDPNYDSTTGCSSGEDAITLQGQSTHIWFDHDDISDGTDGNLDITHASDYITVSWTKFHYTPRTDTSGSDSTGAAGHRYSNLVGGSDSNGSEDSGHLRVTWHHNWWADNVVERQPRVRFGQVHLFNNLWTSSTANYCIGLGVSANIRTENNIFIGVKTPLNTSSYSNASSAVRSTGNVYTNTTGSAPTDVNASGVFDPATSYTYTVQDTNGLQAAIQNGVGPK